MPEGIGLNMRLNNKDYVVPMVTEEPSIVGMLDFVVFGLYWLLIVLWICYVCLF